MKNISKFEPEDFLQFILSKIERVSEDSSNNYQHTADRVHYNPETGYIWFEEVCINQYGSCYGRGVFGSAMIPTEWNPLLPECLTTGGCWGDF